MYSSYKKACLVASVSLFGAGMEKLEFLDLNPKPGPYSWAEALFLSIYLIMTILDPVVQNRHLAETSRNTMIYYQFSFWTICCWCNFILRNVS
jgi:hypothetical protein